MAARPSSYSSFQASQPPTLRPSRFFLLFSRFGSSLRFDALRCFCFCRPFSSLARRAPDAMAPLALQAPRTSNAASALSAATSVRCRLQRKARSFASFPLVLFLLVLVFVFARFLFSFPRLKPTSPTRRLEPPRRDRREKAGSPTPPQSAPGAKPSVPRAFLFAALKTILDRAGDDNLSKGLIDLFG
jgi:hypothetical protein